MGTVDKGPQGGGKSDPAQNQKENRKDTSFKSNKGPYNEKVRPCDVKHRPPPHKSHKREQIAEFLKSMSLNVKRLPFFRSKRDKSTKIVENATKMWSNRFPTVSACLTVLGHCQYDDKRDKVFKVIVNRMNQTEEQRIMHGLKASTLLLFLVSIKQMQAIQIAQNFKQSLKRNLKNLVVVPKDKHATQYLDRVLRQLLFLLENTEQLDKVSRLIRADLIRCYDGLDLIKSAEEGNVFFPDPHFVPYCPYWVYPPANKIIEKRENQNIVMDIDSVIRKASLDGEKDERFNLNQARKNINDQGRENPKNENSGFIDEYNLVFYEGLMKKDGKVYDMVPIKDYNVSDFGGSVSTVSESKVRQEAIDRGTDKDKVDNNIKGRKENENTLISFD